MIQIEIGILRPELRLRVPAVEDSIPVVRQVLRSVGETVDAERESLEDAELAVTEACANAVEHAYGEGQGDVFVTLLPKEADLFVTVRDEGVGMPEDPRRRAEGRGFGLSMIEGIASHVEVRGHDGTEVEMQFPMGRADMETVDGAAPGIEPAERVLRRVMAVVAAQLDMSSERVMETLLIAEIVARNSLRYLHGEATRVSIDRETEGFEISIGPLERGGGEAVVADTDIPVVGPVIAKLADVRIESADDETENLVVTIRPRG
jgi:anti-sigma regulatory factor (Ser/Thr protein kinase)